MTRPTSPPNFDRLAPHYRWLERLTCGPVLQRTRTHHLPDLADRRYALILGDGDGRFTAALLARNRAVCVHAVDTSLSMLHLLHRNSTRATASAFARLRITHADALTTPTISGTDLIVTHFFLDCLTQPQLEALIARLAPTLAPGALWLISDFRIPRGLLHLPARLLVRALYLAFRLFTGLRVTRLPDPSSALLAAGFTLLAAHRPFMGLLTTELWQRPNAPEESPAPSAPPEMTAIPPPSSS